MQIKPLQVIPLLFLIHLKAYVSEISIEPFSDELWRKWEGDWSKDYLEPFRYPEVFRTFEQGYLTPPIVESGAPMPGKRIKVHLSKYPEACYTLFLPYNFTDTDKWPVIVEVPGTAGLCDATHLGYGISRGMNWIWISVPYVDREGKIIRHGWGKDPSTSAKFWLAVLDDLNKKYSIDNDRIVISGFSLGAFAVSSIGNCNDRISSKWAGYFAHSHFDGCCLSCPGNSSKRVNRMKGKKILITAGETDLGKFCSYPAYKRLQSQGFQVTYIEHPHSFRNDSHSRAWICENSEAAEKARAWLDSFLDS